MAFFIYSYDKSKNIGQSSHIESKQKFQQEVFPDSSLEFFTGLLNTSFPLWIFIYLIPILMPTAVLICMENTFWNIRRDGNFVESFQKSFTLYVDSGMRMKAEVEADILRNEQGHGKSKNPRIATNLDSEDFKARFCSLITDHYLRKIH